MNLRRFVNKLRIQLILTNVYIWNEQNEYLFTSRLRYFCIVTLEF